MILHHLYFDHIDMDELCSPWCFDDIKSYIWFLRFLFLNVQQFIFIWMICVTRPDVPICFSVESLSFQIQIRRLYWWVGSEQRKSWDNNEWFDAVDDVVDGITIFNIIKWDVNDCKMSKEWDFKRKPVDCSFAHVAPILPTFARFLKHQYSFQDSWSWKWHWWWWWCWPSRSMSF